MGRMHSKGKGISGSALPYKRTPASWLKISSQDVEENICKFAKKGLTPSQIGVILRDSHGIAQVKSVTGNKILRILKAQGLAPEIPEDLYHLIKKAVAIRKHPFNISPSLQEFLDSFSDTEFWYVDQGVLASDSDGSGSFRKPFQRQEDKWWLPVPRVPPGGLQEMTRK